MFPVCYQIGLSTVFKGLLLKSQLFSPSVQRALFWKPNTFHTMYQYNLMAWKIFVKHKWVKMQWFKFKVGITWTRTPQKLKKTLVENIPSLSAWLLDFWLNFCNSTSATTLHLISGLSMGRCIRLLYCFISVDLSGKM